MQLTSSSFVHEGRIPRAHTCEGEDTSPPLAWTAVPAGTRSLVLIVDDPDAPDPRAPRMTWVHWVIYDLPPATSELPAGIVTPGQLPAGAHLARNDFRRTAWGGPCPPAGRHRYFFKLYAVDRTLGDLGRAAAKPEVERAMHGHVLAEAVLMGTYQKGDPE
jgi:Raf kinase inhibitor-like YbhB/YbcL family protein